jgi:sulfite reductase beta subunit-like hemoprotein
MTPKPPSKVELAKRHGRHLRGSIGETLASDATHFGADDAHLLKFHGTYQQDDRDLRREREAAGREKAYAFMVRVAIPSGAVTAEQYLGLEALADRHATAPSGSPPARGSSSTASSRATSRRRSPGSTTRSSRPSRPAATCSGT